MSIKTLIEQARSLPVEKKGIIGPKIIAPETPNAEVLQWAIECMTSPKIGSPRRPWAVTLTGGKLAHLRDVLERLGIKVEVQPSLYPAIEGLGTEFEREFGAAGLPPYTMGRLLPNSASSSSSMRLADASNSAISRSSRVCSSLIRP